MAPLFAPAVGTFVVMQLDPVATLADLHNEEATAAASKLHSQKYVGFAYEVRSCAIANCYPCALLTMHRPVDDRNSRSR